jgi:hypothetical protein
MSYTSTLQKSTALDYETIQKRIEEQNAPPKKFEKPAPDPRFWKLTRDKAGNGYALIRFLPPPMVNGELEDSLYVRYWDYGFKGPTDKWYIEKSLASVEEADPLAEYNSVLWNQEKADESPGKKQARAQKRRLHYVSNILVINDPAHPENNGKVFLFVYGKKIFDKVQAVMFPKVAGAPRFNPFNPEAGANFNLVIETVSGFPNYDQSRFDPPTPMDEIDAVCSQAHSLREIVSRDKFKTRAELEKRLNEVFGFDVQAFVAANKKAYNKKGDDAEEEFQTSSTASVSGGGVVASDDEDDDDIKKFRNLV